MSEHDHHDRDREQEKPAALSDEERAELEQLRTQVAQAQEERQRAVQEALAQRSGAAPAKASARVDLSDTSPKDRAKRYHDWPERGGSDMPQPWDLPALGLHREAQDFANDNPPGTPDTVSPIVIDHARPLLTYGSSDPSVQELGRILGRLGFANSVSQGQNPFGSVDNTVMAAVFAFRDAYGVQEDPSAFGGNTPAGREAAAAHIGPWTWEAILRAGRQEEQERQAA